MSDLSRVGTTYAVDAPGGTVDGMRCNMVVRFDAMVDPSASAIDIGDDGTVSCVSLGLT